jgi:hypothetical protein
MTVMFLFYSRFLLKALLASLSPTYRIAAQTGVDACCIYVVNTGMEGSI